jgi:DNA-binding CsgD family transcriptional regulator
MVEITDRDDRALLADGGRADGPPRLRGRARDLLALGERLRRARRRAEARAPLRDALAVFENLGADPWSRRARSELRATGERVAGRRGAPSSELTPQELRVALAVADGASNREAAATLFLSPKTVEHHLTSVYGKLGVRSRTALARRLLTPPPGVMGESPMRTGPSSA